MAERIVALFIACVVLSSASCILGPKQDDPANDSLNGEDASADADKPGLDGSYALDSSGGDAAGEVPLGPPDRCGDEADGGDASDGDVRDGSCDGLGDADAKGDAPDSGESGGESVSDSAGDGG